MTTKKLNRKALKNQINGAEPLTPMTGFVQPAIYTGLQEKATYNLFFNDQLFENDFIESLIVTLEDVAVSDSYDRVKIYLSSRGGIAHQLMMLVDYLNNYPLDITFCVVGEICSCASLIPLMVKHADIEYTPTACCMFHYGSTWIHTSALYDNRPNKVGSSADMKGIIDLNNYLWDNFYSKLDLTEDEFEHLKDGRDIFIERERIEHIYTTFKERQFYEQDFDEIVEIVEERIDELKAEIERLEDHKTELYIGLEKFDDEFGLFGEDLEEDELEDGFKVGCTD